MRLPLRVLMGLAWRDLRAGGRGLWVFVSCLVLGVALVAAAGGLHRQIAGSLAGDARALFGGDVEVEAGEPLPEPVLGWLQREGTVSLLMELRTMLRLPDGRSRLIELQAADGAYPLYGTVELSPAQTMQDALGLRNDRWGVALDRVLAERLGLALGDAVLLGDLSVEVRALIVRQPDRGLSADWRGAPVLISAEGLQATGLVQPFSRLEYKYRIKTTESADAWAARFLATFPDVPAEVTRYTQRSERISEVLGQVGSGLMLVGFSALFIGGLGVFNSVRAFLDSRLAGLATLRALGWRDRQVLMLVLLQVAALALLASAGGAVLGLVLAIVGLQTVAQTLPLQASLWALVQAGGLAVAYGVLTALAFALPAVGRALSVSPAVLFRGGEAVMQGISRGTRMATALLGLGLLALLLLVLPDPRPGLLFVAVLAALFGLLQTVLLVLRAAARRRLAQTARPLSFAARLALAGLNQVGSPLRTALLSLGSALTLLVACALVLATLIREIEQTVPRQAPALVMFDMGTDQIDTVREAVSSLPSFERIEVAPLVLGRLVAVNGRELTESADPEVLEASRDEHKFSNRAGNLDDVVLREGRWWTPADGNRPMVAFEDREAEVLGLKVGDRLVFELLGERVEAELMAIYGQRRVQSRLWLEGIFSDGVLDPFITRHVAAARLSAQDAIVAQDRLAEQTPNVIVVRTQALLDEATTLLERASGALFLVAAICLLASLLVLASVVVASRERQLHEAGVLHALGARVSTLERTVWAEYLLLAIITSAFAGLLGSLIASGVLRFALEVQPAGLFVLAWPLPFAVAAFSLGVGAWWLGRQLRRLQPAQLMRGR